MMVKKNKKIGDAKMRVKSIVSTFVLTVIKRSNSLLITAALSSLVLSMGSSTSNAKNTQTTTTTPIKHLVVIFQENVSFDHYFGTYPNALNLTGEPSFNADPNTPLVNGLTEALLMSNPNSEQPTRLDPSQVCTCDQNHDYTPEQLAFDNGLMDMFVENTQVVSCSKPATNFNGLVMAYFDGNTVTALWNYAQNFAMNDNSYETTFGPSTPGVLNLVSGQTHGATPFISGVVANNTVIGDDDPAFDDCSGSPTIAMDDSNQNIGNLLNNQGVTWGWFQGGFKPTTPATGTSKAVCGSKHNSMYCNAENSSGVNDYSPHHEPFQYYASTSNPHHLPPSSVSMIGFQDQANHQYDLSDFWNAVQNGNQPAVSFLKAAKYQDGHAGYSDPLDEQTFLVDTINKLQEMPQWKDMAIIIAYDDSDGWYDHQMSPILNQSKDPDNDALTGPGLCGTTPGLGGAQDRCGYGPRLPLIVISPYAKQNYVDHSITDQTSVLRFIEDNWNLGQISKTADGAISYDTLAGSLDNMFDFNQKGFGASTLILDPTTGEPSK